MKKPGKATKLDELHLRFCIIEWEFEKAQN